MLKKIGKYDITEELGSGGYSRVYRAFDPNVGRPVAIKVSTRASDPEHLSRFKNEASAAGNLRHKNIVTIFDYGDDSGVAYVVMELLNGIDLHKLTQATRKPTLLEKMQIMTQVAEGLHCAHINGVVHRDIKPPNVMVLPDGSVKILDFGVARFTGENSRLTQNGFLVGTPLYMSPEQLKGHDADPLSDIWGYGVLYFELLTGQHPFLAQDNARLIRNITQIDAPPVQTLAHLVPDSLSDVIRRMLTRDRTRRYQSFEEVLVDTNPILAELEQTEVGKLLEEAQSLKDKGQYVQAQRSARRILELDTRNFRALQLLKTVQLKLRDQPPTPQPSPQPAPLVEAKVPVTKAFQLEMMTEAAATVEFVREVESDNVLHPQSFITAEPVADPTPRPKTPEPRAITPPPAPVAAPATLAVAPEPIAIVPEPVAIEPEPARCTRTSRHS